MRITGEKQHSAKKKKKKKEKQKHVTGQKQEPERDRLESGELLLTLEPRTGGRERRGRAARERQHLIGSVLQLQPQHLLMTGPSPSSGSTRLPVSCMECEHTPHARDRRVQRGFSKTPRPLQVCVLPPPAASLVFPSHPPVTGCAPPLSVRGSGCRVGRHGRGRAGGRPSLQLPLQAELQTHLDLK
ncbi:unnamed protein product [Pleuronectes platessa]|uniref:Uncharacterized protein n=1 Tax=Pleuronectes platessa TaxID=8262 RepID=A0A9N7UP69_PLEPL|nr:unnamed protein product [Pleuronectes platessa]